MRRIGIALCMLLATAISSWAQSPTVTYMSGLSNAAAMSGANQFVLCQQSSCGSGQTLVNGTLSQVLTYIEGQLGTAAQVNTGTSGATLGLLNGNLTFSGNDVFSGNLTFSGLTTGTQVSCLGLTSGNAVIASNGACGSGGGGSLTVTDGTHSVTSTTTLTTGNGTVVGGSAGSATLNLAVTDPAAKTADYTAAAADMINALNFTTAGTSYTNGLTLPAHSSSIFAPGMTLAVLNSGTSSPPLTNSTGLTLTGFNGSVFVPGANGLFVANADGTHLDFFGMNAPTTTAIGGVMAKDCSGGGQFVQKINTDGTETCATPAGGGNVSTSGTLTNNALVIGQGSQSVAVTTTGTGVLTALGNNTNATGGVGTVGTSGSNVGLLNANKTDSGVNTFSGVELTSTETPSISTSTFTPLFNTTSGAKQNIRIVLVHASCPCTLANPASLGANQSGMFEIVQSATGSDTIGTYGSEYEYAGGTASITLSTAANAVDYLPYYVDSTGSFIVLGGIIKGPTH